MPRCTGTAVETWVLDTATTTCAVAAEQRKHVFDIHGYSQHKALLGVNTFIRSGTFTVGGYDWSLKCFPGRRGMRSAKYVSVYLELANAGARVRASCDLSLVNQRTGEPCLVSRTPQRIFDKKDGTWFAPTTYKFMKRSKLEAPASGFVHGDRLVIECVVTVHNFPRNTTTTSVPRTIESPRWPEPEEEAPPPSELSRDLAKLFESKEGADVTFVVSGESFSAHRTVLAMRSPVFMAAVLDGEMKASPASVVIDKMQPAAFKALLHYIYVDSLPAMDGVDAGRKREILMGLLAAADRFGVQRLKTMCEGSLRRSLHANTVIATLNLAEKHHCKGLRESCLRFIASYVDQMK